MVGVLGSERSGEELCVWTEKNSLLYWGAGLDRGECGGSIEVLGWLSDKLLFILGLQARKLFFHFDMSYIAYSPSVPSVLCASECECEV